MSGTTDIFEIARERKKAHLKKNPVESKAEEAHYAGLKIIQEIQGTQGYEAIKGFWKNELSTSMELIGKINAIDHPGQTTKIQERIDLSMRFLYYLSIYENNG